jgi:hypothetical protein
MKIMNLKKYLFPLIQPEMLLRELFRLVVSFSLLFGQTREKKNIQTDFFKKLIQTRKKSEQRARLPRGAQTVIFQFTKLLQALKKTSASVFPAASYTVVLL